MRKLAWKSISDRNSSSAAGRKNSRSTAYVSSDALLIPPLVDLIRSKGLEKINLDDLVEELLPKGRALVPTTVKEDLLARIKNYLENDPDYKRLTGF